MFEEQLILQRLNIHSFNLQPSELETLWDVVTKILPDDRTLLKMCYIEVVKETYEHAGIQIPKWIEFILTISYLTLKICIWLIWNSVHLRKTRNSLVDLGKSFKSWMLEIDRFVIDNIDLFETEIQRLQIILLFWILLNSNDSMNHIATQIVIATFSVSSGLLNLYPSPLTNQPSRYANDDLTVN